jgi:hypothetical protein
MTSMLAWSYPPIEQSVRLSFTWHLSCPTSSGAQPVRFVRLAFGPVVDCLLPVRFDEVSRPIDGAGGLAALRLGHSLAYTPKAMTKPLCGLVSMRGWPNGAKAS